MGIYHGNLIELGWRCWRNERFIIISRKTRYLFHYDTNGQPIYHSISVSLFDALKKHHLHFDMIEPFIPKERENEKK